MTGFPPRHQGPGNYLTLRHEVVISVGTSAVILPLLDRHPRAQSRAEGKGMRVSRFPAAYSWQNSAGFFGSFSALAWTGLRIGTVYFSSCTEAHRASRGSISTIPKGACRSLAGLFTQVASRRWQIE